MHASYPVRCCNYVQEFGDGIMSGEEWLPGSCLMSLICTDVFEHLFHSMHLPYPVYIFHEWPVLV